MYIDPNTGGMLFQVLAVIFGVFSGMVLIFSSKIRMFFARLGRIRRGKEDAHEPGEDPAEEEVENKPA